MPYHPRPSRAPFNLEPIHARFLYLNGGAQVPIVRRSRRRVVVDIHGQRLTLSRRALEQHGIDHAGGHALAVTSYPLEEIA